ncbi:MAG: hypothetical protein ACOYBU_16785 [Dermatophilaceae bacterium]
MPVVDVLAAAGTAALALAAGRTMRAWRLLVQPGQLGVPVGDRGVELSALPGAAMVQRGNADSDPGLLQLALGVNRCGGRR